MTRFSPTRIGASQVLLVPRRALVPADGVQAASLVEDALGHPEGRDALAKWLGVEVDRLEEPQVRATAIRLLAAGHWRAVELDGIAQGGPPLPPRPDPVKPPEPVDPPRDRPTRIALRVVDEDGLGFARTRWVLTLPDGTERTISLDEASRWRADDVLERGTCHLRAPGELPEPGAAVKDFSGASPDDPCLGEGDGSVGLVTGREHTVVVVRGRTEVVLLDAEGRAQPGVRCEVTVAGRVRSRVTDDQGLVVVGHGRWVEDVHVRFVELPVEGLDYDGPEALASPGGAP